MPDVRLSSHLERGSDVIRHVRPMRSPRHRGRRAFPPLRFVCPRLSAREKTRTRRGTAVLVQTGRWVGRSHVGAVRPQMFFRHDRLWSAGIRLVLAPTFPNQIAKTASSGPPTSPMAGRTTPRQGPAPSIMYIFAYAIATVALSHLAGFTPRFSPVHRKVY